MKLSVALCTYNGESFLESQLDSLLDQTRRPDEIVVCDDNSTDRTPEILSRYAQEYPDLFSIHYNESNRGVDANFEQCIRRCDGDAIAICDQDDIWNVDKLERQVDVFHDADAGLVFHNSTLVSESGDPVGTLWDSLPRPRPPLGASPTNQCRSLIERNFVQGATILFDSSLRDHILPIPEYWRYDYWIATIAALRMGITGIDAELLHYRQHGAQFSGAAGNSLVKQLKVAFDTTDGQYRNGVKNWEHLDTYVSECESANIAVEPKPILEAIQSRLQYSQSRADIYNGGAKAALLGWLSNIHQGYYSQFAYGWKSVAKDAGGGSVATLQGFRNP